MKPTAIPEELRYGRVVTMVAPDGVPDDEVLACEAVVDEVPGGGLDGAIRAGIRIELEEGELERLQRKPYFWVFFIGAVNPFLLLTEEDLFPPEEGAEDASEPVPGPGGGSPPDQPEDGIGDAGPGLGLPGDDAVTPGNGPEGRPGGNPDPGRGDGS